MGHGRRAPASRSSGRRSRRRSRSRPTSRRTRSRSRCRGRVSNPTRHVARDRRDRALRPATGGWLRPQQTADATHPGGASVLDLTPSGIFNQAFRFDEFSPLLTTRDRPPDSQQVGRDPQQDAGDLRARHRLRGARRAGAIELDGARDRAGRSASSRAASSSAKAATPVTTLGVVQRSRSRSTSGQLQQYALYVPTTYVAGHASRPRACSCTRSASTTGSTTAQRSCSRSARRAAPSSRRSESRGSNGWYQHRGEYDVFEMWNDVAARFDLDPDRTVVSGYSMGGYATYRLPTLYPGLVAKAFSQVGPPADGIWMPPARPDRRRRDAHQSLARERAQRLRT